MLDLKDFIFATNSGFQSVAVKDGAESALCSNLSTHLLDKYEIKLITAPSIDRFKKQLISSLYCKKDEEKKAMIWQ